MANKRILWIDDDVYVLQSILLPLEKRGHQVEKVDNLGQAEELVKQNGADHFHLLVVDMLMPPHDNRGEVPLWLKDRVHPSGANGAVFIHHARHNLCVPGPILILSIVGDPISEYQLEDDPSLHFVHKPRIKSAELVEKVIQLIERA